MVRFFIPNLGVDGILNMFAFDGIYTIIRVFKNIHLTIDRRGGLEHTLEAKLAYIPLSTSFDFLNVNWILT